MNELSVDSSIFRSDLIQSFSFATFIYFLVVLFLKNISVFMCFSCEPPRALQQI